MAVIHEKTIEWNGEEWEVVGHGEYEDSSVLAGQSGRWVLDCYETEAEAREEHPDAEVINGNTYRPPVIVPDCAPAWFDPADAGEAWGEEDY